MGLPCFILAPPSPYELRGWLDLYRCGIGLDRGPGGAVVVGALMWLGCPGDPIGRRGGLEFLLLGLRDLFAGMGPHVG